ncbi:MAG: DUF4190 domain-containing protein [Bacteroidota bacterium]|nr:DUF4190 domain-containing protein [Bacteroidota bacterium]
MKKYLIIIALSFFCDRGYSAVSPASANSSLSLTIATDPLEYFSTLSMKEVQQLVGRKLKFKEKIAVKFLQWKMRKGFSPSRVSEKKDKGKTAMIFGIIALASLFIPVVGGLASLVFAILALVFGYQAKKANPEDRKANTGIILGWVTIGLFVIAVAIVIAVLTTWGWG